MNKPGAIIFTNKAQCQDCYRCLRNCPVKAIRMHDGQAQVVEELCIHCGTCIRECPQGAKMYRDDIMLARQLLAADTPVAASIAPSFASVFKPWQQKRLASALRQLGFMYVGETAIGAFHVACKTSEYIDRHPDFPHICSACPAVVNYIERHRPELLDFLTPVVSPMLAHAQHIRRLYHHNVRVIFIGPCIAKKGEAQRPDAHETIDCVLTFKELATLFQENNIDLAACEESGFNEIPAGDARLFPIEGGAIKTAAMTTDLLSDRILAVSGVDKIVQAFDILAQSRTPLIIEPLFCDGGCIHGPALPDAKNIFQARQEVLTFAQDRATEPGNTVEELPGELAASFQCQRPAIPEFTEEQIRGVLLQTGKAAPADELNCGACGYPSCRSKAIAVLRGLAEPEMCIPYMRRMAERRTDRIIETSPNGIVILDEHLKILGMNTAFKRMFMCTDTILGKPISYLIDPDDFEKLANGEKDIIEASVVHKKYNLVCHQILYGLKEERQYIGIFVNITQSQNDRDKLRYLRAETMLKAQELLTHQFSMAQKMVQFLGESTADGEELLRNLITLTEEGDRPPLPPKDKDSRWDTRI